MFGGALFGFIISSKLGCGKSKTDSPVHRNCGTDNGKMAGTSPKNMLFPAPNSPQRLNTFGASPKARNKVILKPGRSLMDWIRLGRSGADLTGVGGKSVVCTPEELAKHNTQEDAWIAIRGKIYNITPYMEYHPGGEDELMRGAGIDSTQLFDEIHKWVNAESMLDKCYVGRLETPSPAGGGKGGKGRKGSTTSGQGVNGAINTAALKPPEPQTPTYDWFQSKKLVTIVVYTRWKKIHADHVTIDKNQKTLRVAIEMEDEPHMFKIHIELEQDVNTDYTVKASSETGKIEILLPKRDPEKQWSSLGKPLRGDMSYVKRFQAEKVFRECTVKSVSAVTHDVILFAITPPDGCRLPVPIGHHVQIKCKLQGVELFRSYTAALPSFKTEKLDPDVKIGRAIYFLIKIYSNGAVSPFIGTLNAGDSVTVSDSEGSFQFSQLTDVTHLVMFAAGTGFTPMVHLIYHTVVAAPSNSVMQVHLVFYNKKMCDIIWREQLDALASQHERFKVTYVLSDEGLNWDGLKGRVCKEHIDQFVPKVEGDSNDNCGSDRPTTTMKYEEKANPLVCVCGPPGFAVTAAQLLTEHGLGSRHMHLFQG